MSTPLDDLLARLRDVDRQVAAWPEWKKIMHERTIQARRYFAGEDAEDTAAALRVGP